MCAGFTVAAARADVGALGHAAARRARGPIAPPRRRPQLCAHGRGANFFFPPQIFFVGIRFYFVWWPGMLMEGWGGGGGGGGVWVRVFAFLSA